MRTNSHEMMHRTERADCSPFLDNYVSAKCSRIGENDMIANHTIVRDVCVCHYQYVIAHACQAAALYGATIDGGKLADYVVVANLEARWFACIADVLWCEADTAKREELIVRANPGRAFDHNM